MTITNIQLRIPIDLILSRTTNKSFAKMYKNGKSIRATLCRKLPSLEDKSNSKKIFKSINKFL